MEEVVRAMGLFLLFMAIIITVGAVVALPIMLLWDWLMPTLFGLGTITWFQSWGLLVFCSLLFKPWTSSGK